MKPIFQAHTCLSEQDIRKYLDGQLDAAARHRVENHLLDCPLCEDALEGYELMRQATPKPVAQSQPLRAVRGGRLSLVRIAASLLFVIASVLIYYFVFTTPNPENLYQAYYEPYESEMMQLFRQGASPR
jgi:anti-sigma factor RsiW